MKPVQVTASAKYEEDFSAGEFKNIVTTTVTVSFWNVGALASGYGGAVMAYKSVSSLNQSEATSRCSGTFTGGPSGSFTFACEGFTLQLRLLGGQMIQMGEHTLRVQNSEAFANWP